MNSKKRLLIAADVDRTFTDRVLRDARFEVRHEPVRSESDLARVIGDAEVLVTRAYNDVTRRVLDAAPHLELIAQGTSGTDNIDEPTVRERGITVISLPGENANAVAELVIGFMIALTRTVPFYDRQMRDGIWQRDDCATRHELSHFRLGIVGLGQVGGRVARMAAAFSMNVRAFDPYIDDPRCVATLDDLLAESDILALHVPLNAETSKMIAAPQLAQLPRGAYVINASRGGVLDVQAAFDALAANQLNGIALDVYEPEPPSIRFPDDPRLILTPHIAGCSTEAKASIGVKLYEKLVAFYS
ncbi:MAG: D-3-phosphoglycerate dehydrogenase / 2-oxoglutarate reductase [Acidobacteriota bacterium]|jgi:phosphoglycerate dehydrogenase-like enzyme|nr:D-3-phosphoglycerate dehydrogenase / 2-oxoglutarate reductase [Acidobacteriota bacterium]